MFKEHLKREKKQDIKREKTDQKESEKNVQKRNKGEKIGQRQEKKEKKV